MQVICLGSGVDWFTVGKKYNAEKISNGNKIIIYDDGDDGSGIALNGWGATKIGDEYISWSCSACFREVN